MTKEIKYIEDCLILIGDKFSWGIPSHWSSNNFEVLSYDILDKTGINISSRTLQRLAQGKIKYSPQYATKNAIAKYIGYKSWEDYLLKKHPSDSFYLKKQPTINSFILKHFWLLQFFIVILLSSFFIFFYPSIKFGLNKSKIVFQTNDQVGTAPHNASFFYDISKINSGNVFLDKNVYAEGEMIPLKKFGHFFNTTFELPDYYAMKIVANGKYMVGLGIHVVTQGWAAVINENLYVNTALFNDSGYLHVDKNNLKSINIETDSNLTVDFRNIRDFGISGDNMSFETRFMNNADIGGYGCYDTKIELINANGRLSFNFVSQGCDKKKLKAKFGDIILAGEFNNLNTFFQDISYWRNLKIITGNKRVGVYLDNVQIYSIIYNENLGDVKGVSISFVGSGAVDYVNFYNSESNLIYSENFDIHL